MVNVFSSGQQNTVDVPSSILLGIVSPVYYWMHRIKTNSCLNNKTIFIFLMCTVAAGSVYGKLTAMTTTCRVQGRFHF
jgi:hypothetical protein